MKNVLHLIGSFHQGGSERQALALAGMMNENASYQIHLAALNGEGILRPEAEAITGGRVNEFPLTSFYDANFFRQVSRFVRALTELEIDIIHTHDFYTNVFGMTAATLARVPVRIASKRETTGVRTQTQELVERIAFTRAHAVLANSHAVRRLLVRSGLSREKVKLVYNGVNIERFTGRTVPRAAVCKQFGLPTAKDVQFVSTVANRRHPVKNIPMLLRAAKRVTRELSNAHFVIAGEGELGDELRRQAEELAVSSNVHFVGRVDDVPALLAVSTACVLTSNAEGFSNAIIEYMAARKPVVATDAGGAAEAVADGETGFIVGIDDDGAMAEKLIMLLKDPVLSKQMGEQGRRRAEDKFSSDAQLSAVMSLYEEYLTEGETRSDAGVTVTPRYLENEASHS